MLTTSAWRFSCDDAGIACKAYHAGLKNKDRSRVLADWTSGILPVVAATVAFGMGIDKSGEFRLRHVSTLEPSTCK